MQWNTPPTPGALARVRVIVSRSVIIKSAPSAPLAGTSGLHRGSDVDGTIKRGIAGRARRRSSSGRAGDVQCSESCLALFCCHSPQAHVVETKSSWRLGGLGFGLGASLDRK